MTVFLSMDAGIGAKATSWTACQGNVLDCMGGDGEGICASLQDAGESDRTNGPDGSDDGA